MSAEAGQSADRRSAGGPPWLGVVIVHFGDPEPTRRAIAAVAADRSPVRRRLAVVDNSANLADGDLLTAGADNATHHLRCPDNPGFGAGANRGVALLDELAAAAGEPPANGYVVLNGDVELLPGYLAAAATALGAENRDGALGAENRDGALGAENRADALGAENRADAAAGGLPVGAAAGPLYLGRAPGPLWYAGGRLRPATGTVWQSTDPADAAVRRAVSFLPGAALAVSRRAWLAVGGFDPGFFLYNEDVDLCRRLARAGFRLLFEPAMAAVHTLGGATGSADASPFYLRQLTRTRLRPYPSLLHRLWLALLHSGWVALRAGRHALAGGAEGRRRAAALLAGHREALGDVWRRPPPPEDPAG